MSELEPAGAFDPSDLPRHLQELARLLQEADHLDPQAQQELAELVAELSQALARKLPSAEVEHLGQSAVHLIQALHQQENRDYLTAARDRLRAAAVRAEVQAPVATGIVRRLIDTLANLGI
jgi:hypothetical protein